MKNPSCRICLLQTARWFCCLACLLLMAASAVAQATPSPERLTTEKQRALFDKLKATISQADRELDGVLGVAVLDLTNGDQFLLRGDEVFPQASSIKIALLAELYHQQQQAEQGIAGKAKLTDLYTVRQADLVPDSFIMGGLTPGVTRVTNRDLATMVVAVSDNSATNVLIDRVGMDSVNAFMDSLGLKNTRLRRKMMDLEAAKQGRENVSTPREMMTLLQAIQQGRVFNPQLTKDFLEVLSTYKESALLRGLPEGVRAANKPGELEGVRTDSGIVYAPNRPFVLCVMTTYLADPKAGEDAITKITAAAYSYFDRVGRASSYGRVISPR